MNRIADKLIIAKAGNQSSFWLPLWMHHRDTAMIMEHLLDEFVPSSISVSCGMELTSLRKTAVFIALTHDIGKTIVGFQYKIAKNVPYRLSTLESYGFKIPDDMIIKNVQHTPHALAGEAILLYMGCPESIATVIGAHHGSPSEKGEIDDLGNNADIGYPRNYFGDEEINRELLEEIWGTIIEYALSSVGLESIDDLKNISAEAQMILSGLLITADWIASDTEHFPLISVDDVGEESMYPNRVDEAWSNLCLPEMWKSHRTSYSDTEFEDTFKFIPSTVQRQVIDTVMEESEPGLLILEAPMGCGKTEAALSSAEILAEKHNKNGLFFGMPTQATANGIFPRIMNWAEKQSEDFYHSIYLKHGSSELNKTFQNIQKGIPDEESDSGLVVHSWFCNNKKACLANFVVATVDQMLMMALKRKHVMLLHLGLSEKVVVIDEVHAYDAYMNQYLERALQWLGAYHTPVILLSATLPAKRRMSLVRSYLGVRSSDENFEKNISYPLLTWTNGKEINQKSLTYEGTHKTVEISKCTDNAILEIIRSAVEAGGCVGLIVNTVSRAQSFAEMIRHEVTNNILLYHAQFIMPDRAKKEKELLETIGSNSNADTRSGFVVIGTQVLEQSLDIDFDLLITDICPIDLLLQRIGRLHRHEREHRPDELKPPKCKVITDEFDNERSGSRNIYGVWLLQKTLAMLPDKITLPDDISPLVQKIYGAFDESEEYKEYTQKNIRLERDAMSFLLKKPKRDIHNLFDRLVSDEHAEASVRDGISSIEVLLMKLYDDSIWFIDDTKLSEEMSQKECEKIAKQKLRLPSKFSHRWNIDKTINELDNKCRPYTKSWQNNYLLKDQLVLFLDENNEAELGIYHLKYDFANGLICKKRSDEVE